MSLWEEECKQINDIEFFHTADVCFVDHYGSCLFENTEYSPNSVELSHLGYFGYWSIFFLASSTMELIFLMFNRVLPSIDLLCIFPSYWFPCLLCDLCLNHVRLQSAYDSLEGLVAVILLRFILNEFKVYYFYYLRFGLFFSCFVRINLNFTNPNLGSFIRPSPFVIFSP